MKKSLPEFAIEIQNVTKSYKDISSPVLTGVDLTVNPGQILGILGRNGAGKSTLINLMCGLLQPSTGSIRVWNKNPLKYSIGKHIGYAPQDISVYPHLTAQQNLQCMGEIQGLSHREAQQRSQEIIHLLGLEKARNQNATTLSGGQKRRLHTGMALIHQPQIAFLDEPTVGADVEARSQILETIIILAQQGMTVIYTSHYLQEFEQLKADIAVLNKGKIVVKDSLENIVSQYSEPTIRVFCARPEQHVVQGWKIHDDYLELDYPALDQGAAIAQLLSSPEMTNADITDISIVQPSLENAYLNIIR